MPNRGPAEFSREELESLLLELPNKSQSDAEDSEERQRIKVHIALRSRIEEQQTALIAADSSARGAVIFSIDEVDELLDCMPPPPALSEVRSRLAELHRALLEK